MMAVANERRDLEALLPFYVNGTLAGDERLSVDAALKEDARLRDEAEALSRLRRTMKDIDDGPSPGEFGLARLMRDIDRLEAPAQAPRRRGLILPWSIAAAASAGFLALALGWMSADQSEPFRQASGVADALYLTVAFQPDVAQSAVSGLLLEYGLEIVEGPSALGLYRVDPGAGRDLEALAAELRDRAEVIESVDMP
jgi:anti-sigma factor RsiW